MPISPAANEALLVIDGAPTIKMRHPGLPEHSCYHYLNGKRNRATRRGRYAVIVPDGLSKRPSADFRTVPTKHRRLASRGSQVIRKCIPTSPFIKEMSSNL